MDYTAFSYSGLVEQLEYEGFSNESSTFAVDNCGADWNEQAAKKLRAI
ncbi:Ltp family lipoprotein [Blautia sp. RD014234]|nr:Ltp family lipoprotein [Blautia parvula]